MNDSIKIGLIGFGTVGTGVVKLLFEENKPLLRDREIDIDLIKIADLDIISDRGIKIPDGILTTNVDDILDDPQIGIVIELIGGYEPARSLTLRAFEKGKCVVTANKALIAKYGRELFEAANNAGISYLFEASVGGGIPIIRGLNNGLNANTIKSIYGILNGTTNYILSGMTRDGVDYDEVLAMAQKLGYAEADPTSDVSGQDALNKIVILVRLAFGADLNVETVFCEGIENLTVQDIDCAGQLGYTVKLLAIAKRHEGNRIEVRVHPTLVPSESIMAYVEDEFNAVEVDGSAVGRELFYGKGAGMMPTASAVVSDCIDIASRLNAGTRVNFNRHMIEGNGLELIAIEDITMRYYLRFTAKDQPGVLFQISKIFADENISIESVIQLGASDSDYVPLVIMTHDALEGDMRRAMRQFEKLEVVHGRIQLIRVEDI
ncbi:MAG: homoserine dehydrogenase [Candidatus Latescibacteria bacterium]|nr:homoserine dehydrogenase [Candidatus Latescibacterota bacterium]